MPTTERDIGRGTGRSGGRGMSASLFFELVATVACGVIGIVAVGTIVQPDAARPPRVRRDRRDDLLP